jgi:hypothetical protein
MEGRIAIEGPAVVVLHEVGYLPVLRERALRDFSVEVAPLRLARRQYDGVMCSTRLKLRVKAAWSQNPDRNATSTRDLLVRESRSLARSIRS